MRGFCGCVELGNSVPLSLLENSFCVNCTSDREKSRKGMIKSDDSLGLSMYKRTPVRVSIIIHKHAEKVELNEMCQIARQR